MFPAKQLELNLKWSRKGQVVITVPGQQPESRNL